MKFEISLAELPLMPVITSFGPNPFSFNIFIALRTVNRFLCFSNEEIV